MVAFNVRVHQDVLNEFSYSFSLFSYSTMKIINTLGYNMVYIIKHDFDITRIMKCDLFFCNMVLEK